MKKILLVSAACLLTTSFLIAQTREEAPEDYLYDLALPNSTLQKLLRHRPELDSLLGGKFFYDSLKIYTIPPSNPFDSKRQSRTYNMPEFRMRSDYSPIMPEHHANPGITYIMPEAKFPGLIRDKSKAFKLLKKKKRDK